MANINDQVLIPTLRQTDWLCKWCEKQGQWADAEGVYSIQNKASGSPTELEGGK